MPFMLHSILEKHLSESVRVDFDTCSKTINITKSSCTVCRKTEAFVALK